MLDDDTSARRNGATVLWCALLCLAMLAAACSSGTSIEGTPEASPSPAEATPSPTGDPEATVGPTATEVPEPTTAPTPDTTPPRPVETDVVDGFDTRTVQRIETVDQYWALAREGIGGQSITKFAINDFANEPSLHWFDSNFYTLHDEFYWYWLLNGLDIPGGPYEAIEGLSFPTVQDVYDWANAQDEDDLPLGLELRSDGRLVSSEVYSLANADSRPDRKAEVWDKFGYTERFFGFGSLLYQPERTEPEYRPEYWLIELEFSDDADPAQIAVFFEMISASIPMEIAAKLQWVIRSPVQELTAQEMEANELPYSDRLVRYDELVIPGEVQVYSGAITAGRVTRIGEGEKRGFDDTTEFTIILTDQIPDFLPPARALITAVPQTPLAHVNILARNRGIPNAYLGGLFDDPNLNSMARVLAPALVYAESPGNLQIVQMTEAQYKTWLLKLEPDPIAVPQVDLGAQPYTYDLTELSGRISTDQDIEDLRPIIGGKAAGFLGLLAPGDLNTNVTTPDDPMAITVRAYQEHLAQIDDEVNEMLTNETFMASARARYLILEGVEDFDELYDDLSDLDFRERFFNAYSSDSLMGRIVEAGGFKRYLRDLPMDPDTLAEITLALEDTYGDYADSQGLRFRSSSSVEDIEGFNGAGLYDSNTGYLDAAAQDEDDQKRTVEWAIKKTWASYWGSEAFEERELEAVDHLSGGMGVVVHARFDDELEVNNGVFTFTVLPDGNADRYVMEINVQDGFESVTNPTPESGAVPEVVTVRAAADGSGPTIERLASSNLVPEGQPVLEDSDLLEIFQQATAVTELWLERVNDGLPAAQHITSLTLDFEFREMGAGWPALATGPAFEQRIVIKQARSLDPGLRGLSTSVLATPVPRDILARAIRVERVTCSGDGLRLEVVDVYTDGLRAPEFPYSNDPFVGSVLVEFTEDFPEVDREADDRFSLDWRSYSASHPAIVSGAGWDLDLSSNDANAVLKSVAVNTDRVLELQLSSGTVTADVSCGSSVLLETPEDYLLSLVPAPTG